MNGLSIIKWLSGVSLLTLFFASCSIEQSDWQFRKEVKLDGIGKPLSIEVTEEGWWIADPENNRVVLTDERGKIKKTYPGFQRPMHLCIQDGKIYVPEYLSDSVKVIENDTVSPFPLKLKPDAPAGISSLKQTFAIADFYNHRIILQEGNNVSAFGTEGHEEGELYYPTDVKLFDEKIYVADAYNNRIQVFDRTGAFVKIIGAEDQLKVASGIDVAKDIIAVTDQENNRVLLYNPAGRLLQTLERHIDYPTDVSFFKDKLYVSNFRKSAITVYEQSP